MEAKTLQEMSDREILEYFGEFIAEFSTRKAAHLFVSIENTEGAINCLQGPPLHLVAMICAAEENNPEFEATMAAYRGLHKDGKSKIIGAKSDLYLGPQPHFKINKKIT